MPLTVPTAEPFTTMMQNSETLPEISQATIPILKPIMPEAGLFITEDSL